MTSMPKWMDFLASTLAHTQVYCLCALLRLFHLPDVTVSGASSGPFHSQVSSIPFEHLQQLVCVIIHFLSLSNVAPGKQSDMSFSSSCDHLMAVGCKMSVMFLYQNVPNSPHCSASVYWSQNSQIQGRITDLENSSDCLFSQNNVVSNKWNKIKFYLHSAMCFVFLSFANYLVSFF